MSIEPNKPEPKDMPVNIRMLVAFALTGLVIFGTPYFYKLIGVKEPETTEQQATAPATPQPTTYTPATAAAPAPVQPVRKPAATPAGSAATPATVAGSEETITLDTDLYHIIFSNRGASVKSWRSEEHTSQLQ